MNPFQHGVAVSGRDFCPRPDLVAELQGHMAARQNCVVRGMRRVGKTSTVLEAIRKQPKTNHIYVNCWGKQDVRSLTTAIYEALLVCQQRRGISLEKVMRTFSHLRPKASIDPYSGATSLSVDLASTPTMTPESLELVFSALAIETEKNPLIVVLDEFQALQHLPDSEAVLATLRGAIQLQPNSTYFYLGSVRHQMDELFNNPDQPFFKSAASVVVEPIPRKDFGAYIRKKLKTGDRTISPDALETVFDMACDITGDVQLLCSELWNCTDRGEQIEVETISAAVQRIHRAEQESNARIIDLLTPGQVRVLIGLARVGGKAPTSRAFLQSSGIAQPSSVTKALSRLIDRGLVYRTAGGIEFFSPFFRTWLLTQDF